MRNDQQIKPTFWYNVHTLFLIGEKKTFFRSTFP
uniref:Uncharacterized protein n=1 Tax=Rhizophora mucronata TaxID=61149 RepID=A0A2P2Q5E4_RHIMU